jgi:hypothetical protein
VRGFMRILREVAAPLLPHYMRPQRSSGKNETGQAPRRSDRYQTLPLPIETNFSYSQYEKYFESEDEFEKCITNMLRGIKVKKVKQEAAKPLLDLIKRRAEKIAAAARREGHDLKFNKGFEEECFCFVKKGDSGFIAITEIHWWEFLMPLDQCVFIKDPAFGTQGEAVNIVRKIRLELGF